MRFRKSIKICKGVKINFSKSGASCTFGIPGCSVNVGKKGTYLNSGIPGTGLYNRTKLGGYSNNKKLNSYNNSYNKSLEMPLCFNLQLNEDGSILFYNNYGGLITDPAVIRKIKATDEFKSKRDKLMEESFSNINSKTESIINIYKLSPKTESLADYTNLLESLKPMVYLKNQYTISEPTMNDVIKILKNEAESKVCTKKFWKIKALKEKYVEDNKEIRFSELYSNWKNEKEAFEKKENEIEQRKNDCYLQEYNSIKGKLEGIIHGDVPIVENEIKTWLSTVELPIDFDLQFEYNKNTLMVDLDLPEIEDMPTEKAAKLANGTVKKKNKTQKEVKEDYVNCVFGLAVFFASNLFNLSPSIKNIVLSGYTQRRNQKTGDIQDDYVYSIKFLRDVFEKRDNLQEKPLDFCMKFENRCNITSTMIMKTIKPFEE